MNFLDKIKTDMYDAMKSSDKDKAGTLRTLLAKLKDRQINNRKDLTEKDCISVIKTLVKQREEAADMYEKAGRESLAQKEKYAAKVNSINFKFPLRSYRRGFFQGNTDTISAVRENIKTLLLTLKGERVNDANLGTNIPVLQGQLFEPITREETFENIRLEIETAIATTAASIKPIICRNCDNVHGAWTVS